MSRKITYILIVAIILLGAAGWWFFSHENSAPAQTSSEVQTSQNLFPYGQNATSSASSNNQQTNNGQTVVVGGISTPTTPLTLVHITTTPVSGMIFLPENKNSASTTLRYIDRGTGHIYDYSFDTGTSTEVTDTTIPKVYRGIFSGTGTRVYLQTLDDSNEIETLSAAVSSATTTGVGMLTDVRFLPKNIMSIAPNGSSLFYLVSSASGSTGYVSALSGTNPSQAFSSALSELSTAWPSTDVTLLTKGSASAGGYLFNLNTKTGAFAPIIHDINGLTALESPSGTFAFGSASIGGTIESFIYNEKTDVSQTIPLNTLADKCVWSNLDSNTIYCAVPTNISGTLPDDWYQGNVYLADDNIWKITADTGITNIVDFLSEMNPSIDAENLSLDQSEKWLTFVNKEDLTLWALRIAQ